MAQALVIYPVTSTGINNLITAGYTTTYIPKPTAATVISNVIQEFSVGRTTTYTIPIPQTSLSQTALPTITVGLEGNQKTFPAYITTPTSSAQISATSSATTTTNTFSSDTVTSSTSGYSSTSAASDVASSTSSGSIASSTNHSDNDHKKGISTGEAAGIGIGCGLAIALAAIALFWLLTLRRKSKRSRGYSPRSPPSDGSASLPDKAGSTTAMQPMLPLAARNGDRSDFRLPPPESNSALAQMFSRLETLIKNYAHSYFSGGSAGGAQPAIKHGHVDSVLGAGAQLNAKQLSEALGGSQRISAIRYLLGWAIVSNIDAQSSSDQTLLPPEFVECLHSMQQNGNSDSTLLSKWRHLTGTLLRPTYGSKMMGASDLRQRNITKLVDTLDEILAPLGATDKTLERRSNLEGIIKQAAQSGYTLLTQPTAWEFQWDDARSRSGKDLVVFPELVQVEDDQGKQLERPQAYGTKQTIKLS